MTRNARILLVEDDIADARLTQEALRACTNDHDLRHVRSGDEALAVLGDPSPLPDLILLDLNMPGLAGLEVLDRIKHDPALRHIPVTVFTTSDAPEDVAASYSANANAYVRKPVSLDEFFDVIADVERFWTDVVELHGGADR